MDVNQSTGSRILKQARTTGTLAPKRKEKCGRKRKTLTRDDIRLLRESKEDPRKTSDMLRKDLLSSGVNVSSSTVRRRLIECGRMARRPVKKQLLTAAMKKKRLDWAKKCRNWTAADWRKVLFSDESHFLVQGKRSQHVHRSIGEPIRECHMDQSVKHPPKKMFWGSFSYHGIGSLLPIEGMMNAGKYIQVLEEKVVRDLAKAFPDGSGVYQQDSAPCHRAKKVMVYMKKMKITVLDWPGNSPDLNPIENLRSIMKLRLRNEDCTTKIKLIEAIIRIWYRDPEIKENSQKLVDSMPNRVQQVLKNNGGHIMY